MNKTAIVFGVTGLVGSYLLDELIQSNIYSEIKVFVRKEIDINEKKITIFLIDFEKIENYSNLIKGDDLYCCLGTTVKKSGSKTATRKVDFDYPVRIAEIAEANNVKQFLVVSSLGANANSKNFYLKSKGLMEKEIGNKNFDAFYTLRPSMLTGYRKEVRIGETIGKIVMLVFNWMLIGKLKRYRVIHGNKVAKAMIYLANSSNNEFIIQSERIKELARDFPV